MDAEPNQARKTRRTRKSRLAEQNGLAPSVSPTPPKRVYADTLSFPAAMQKVIEGKRVTRVEWENDRIYCYLLDRHLRIKLDDGVHDWIISDGDLFGTDWIVCDDGNDRRTDQE